ncbi:MAG: DUF4440 domain-containing protein, partial [Ruminococcus sp.]
MTIKEYETAMWDAAQNRDSEALSDLVDKNAVMVCGGYRCRGSEYSQIVKEFDIASFEISDFEIVLQTDDICQVHYIIVTKVSKVENIDLQQVVAVGDGA